MSLKLRLVVMNFLQFFIWGTWLITIGRYWFETRHWSGTSFGANFSTMGIASLFMPALMGIVQDSQILDRDRHQCDKLVGREMFQPEQLAEIPGRHAKDPPRLGL